MHNVCHITRVCIYLRLTIFIPNSEILDIVSLLYKGCLLLKAYLKLMYPGNECKETEATQAAATKNSGTIHFSSPCRIHILSIYFTSLAQSSQKPEARENLNLGDNPIYPGSVISLCKTKDRLEWRKCRKKYQSLNHGTSFQHSLLLRFSS